MMKPSLVALPMLLAGADFMTVSKQMILLDRKIYFAICHIGALLHTFAEGPLPSVLQEVAVPVINNTVCEAMYRNAGYIEHIPHIFICAGWRNGGFDSCEVSYIFL